MKFFAIIFLLCLTASTLCIAEIALGHQGAMGGLITFGVMATFSSAILSIIVLMNEDIR